MTTHSYETTLTWQGRTSDYKSYSRHHSVTTSDTEITMSADAAFRGDGSLPNPEQLVVAAASSCQLLSFLAVASLAGVEVLKYDDHATGAMPSEVSPMRLTRIVLRPRIIVAGAVAERVISLVHKAHLQCYIANSLNGEVVVEPTIEVV